jgi:phosphinothricin acetyltransferase
MTDMLIRRAAQSDLPMLVEIFNHYVIHSHATFQTELQTVESRQPWFDAYGEGRHQLLVASLEGTVVGYASSSPYRPGPAFETTVETSVYLHPDHRARGTGSALYEALFERMRHQDVHLAVAGIALPNAASLALHRRMGFEEVGTFRDYARKNGSWISSTWLQRGFA